LAACVMFLSPEPFISLAGNPDGAIGDHSLDVVIAVSKILQHLLRMLPHSRGRPGYDGLVDLEASRWFGLPDPTDRRLVEFGDDARATTCSLWMISPRRRIGAQGTSAASRRSSHSAVVCCMMYSAILLMRAVAFTERAAGVAKRGSLASSGSPDARRKPCHSESEIVPAVMYPSLVLNTRSGRSLGSAAAASAPTTIYCIMPSGHRYEIMTSFVMSDPAWPMSRCAQALPTRPSHALGPARSRRFPDGTGRLSPKSRNLQDQRLPFS